MLQRLLAYAESKGTDLGPHARPQVDLNPFERDVQAQLTAAGSRDRSIRGIGVLDRLCCSASWSPWANGSRYRGRWRCLPFDADGPEP